MRLFFVVILIAICFSTHAQTAEKVIKKHIAHIGGEKKWTGIKTLVTTGEYDYGGVAFPFTAYAKAPDLYKFIVPFNGKYYAQAYDGNGGWKIDAFKNETTPTLLSGKAARAMANEADVELESPFIHYADKGHQATLEGKDTIDNKVCFKLRFTRKNGETETYYFDTHSYELVQKLAVSKNEEMQGASLTTSYSDYRKVDGLTFPFKAVSKVNDQTILTVTVKEVKINAPIDTKEFKP